MEFMENQGRVCRLCGQMENIYVDIFGEEGNRRYLGFKIHSKINILIDEGDPLPKVICVQCLGKLEFVCDFQEECLRTQQLLRDQYNLPPLSNIEENKPEATAPSTSTSTENNIINIIENVTDSKINNTIVDNHINNNNNNSNKNLNPPENETSKNENRTTRSFIKSQRNLRSHQNQTKSSFKKDAVNLQFNKNELNILPHIQGLEITTTTRRLRSRQSTEVSEININTKNTKQASIIKKGLRSRNNNVDSTTNPKKISISNQNVGKKNHQDHINKIQIPTNTLNKVLSAITNAPGIGVSVKESTNHNADAEDISFTVELCKKQDTDSLTVLAKVFPDQGSCLVDKSIVTFLEDGTNEEVNNLVNNIVSPNAPKDQNCSLIDKLQNSEDISNSSRNPEELFKMDGKEIHVDENVEQANINNQVKPDDGLPHIICMRCLGTLEFLCDFYSKCHDAQKDFHSIAKIRNIEHAFKDKIESEEESDKENVLPFKRGKSKIKSLERADLQPSKIKEFEGSEILQNVEISNDLIVKINGSLIIDDLQISKCLEGIQESSKILKKNSEDLQKNSESISKKLKTNSGVGLGNITQKSIEYTYTNVVNDLKSKKNISENFQEKLETSMNSVVTQNIAHIVKDNTTIDTVSSNPNTKRELSLSFSRKPEHYEKKFNKCSKPSSFVTRRNKNPYQGCKAVDKYFTETSQYKLLSANEKKLHLNYTECTSYVKINEIAEQNNVTFEETATNTSGNASIIMPSKAETFRKEFRLENIMMVHDNDIVQAEEIALLTNFSQLSKPTKPQSLNSSQGKTDYPSLGDKAEPMPVDETLILEVLAQEENMKSTRKQLIVFEVQLPDKENSVLSKHPADFKRTSLECTYSEGKGAKISELITEKQKKEIEAHYWIDMTLVNKSKVNKNIIVLGKLKYQCKLCETIYPRLDKCQVHIWRHLDMKPYLCKVCDFSTLTVSNIRCHIRKSHLKIKPFKCHLCKKSYNSGTLLEEHLNVHTGARPYKCSHCKFASTSKQVLAHHILIHKSKKDIICDACGKAFYSKGRMRAHQIMHNKDQAYKCTLCSTYVLHKEALERHYINVHSKDHICKICNKAYKSRKALHNHESVHSDAKFKCPLCPNIYKSTHILKEHVLKHQGIRQYKCNSCDKSFAQQSHLAAHMAVHSNITYNCPGCKKGFNRHDNMKVHAKRCQKFLENPELHNLFKKRKISVSKNRTAKACINQEDNSIKKKKLVKSQRYALKKIDKSIKDI